MDKATVPGLVLGLGALFASLILEGGSPASLVNVPAAVLVFGGTFGAAMISFPFHTVMSVPKFLPIAFKQAMREPAEIVETFVRLADKARKEGLLALESETEKLDPFARQGIQLVIDGSDPGLVREVLEAEVDAMRERHKTCYAMLEGMGGYAPTMGIIGTVMGLVNVLSHLDNPDELGHSIATAFIATLYGIFTANIFWLPLGSKLKHKSAEEMQLRNLTIEGILSVQAGDNPRIVRQKLEAQLAPSARGGAAKKPAPVPAAGATTQQATANGG